jgi:CRP/FNR family cyclic AMP-dependent transcriptional regulator
MIENPAPLYRVWGIDQVVYGPIELPTLVTWIKQGHVEANTWVYKDMDDCWSKAVDFSELTMMFKGKSAAAGGSSESKDKLTSSALRRIKIFAVADEKLLDTVLRYLERVEVPGFTVLVQPGEVADSMYFVLEGELRAYVIIDGKESTLATLLPGDSFGELALLDHGVRTAYVAANFQSVVLRLSSGNFQKLIKEMPALATTFSLELARVMATRMRALNKRYVDSIHFGQGATGA